jgi:hypothetical protein
MDALTDFTFNTHMVYYSFCPRCGIRCFRNVMYEVEGQKINNERICISMLDEREDGEPLPELKDIEVEYFSPSDGDQGRRLAVELYSRGMW